MWKQEFAVVSVGESDSQENEIARSTVKKGALFGAVSAAVFAGIYGLGGPSEFVLPHIIVAVMLAIIGIIRPRNASVALSLAITLALLLFGYQLILLAKISTGATVWFLVPFVAAMFTGMFRLATYCFVVAAIEMVGVVVAAHAGWLHARVVLPEADLGMAISMIAVMILCGIFAFITLSARRRLIEEVTTRNEALKRALDETRLARNEAVEASQAKERFFANLTHEIRTPLTGIAGSAELLKLTKLSAGQLPLVKALGVSTQNLAELVNTLLDHAKMRAGHIGVDLAPVNLRDMARDLRDLFGARAADKQLAFSVEVDAETPIWIETDGVKLRQIASNLVANAIKFTAHGSVKVRVHCMEGGGDGKEMRLLVDVADTGMGIAPEQIQAVFKPFVQGDMTIARVYGGTGLGLAIALQLAELLGGMVRADSRLGEGATFSLELPVGLVEAALQDAAAFAGVSAESAEVHREASTVRVLLAEDNAVNRLVGCALLERLDVKVELAENGLEAVEMASKENYQAIFMDLQMPGMDGIAATREIRRPEQIAGKQPLAIIAMTGNSAEDYGSACTEAGMNGFVMKPVSLDQLRDILADLRLAR